LTGLEPAISGLEVRRISNYATRAPLYILSFCLDPPSSLIFAIFSIFFTRRVLVDVYTMPNLSLSFNLGISFNDILHSIRDTTNSAFSSIQNLAYNHSFNILQIFDILMLRAIIVIILLATIVLTVLAIPHAALIVEWCIISLYKAFTILQTQITPQNIALLHQWLLPIGLMLSLL